MLGKWHCGSSSAQQPVALVGWGNRGTAKSDRAGQWERSRGSRLVPAARAGSVGGSGWHSLSWMWHRSPWSWRWLQGQAGVTARVPAAVIQDPPEAQGRDSLRVAGHRPHHRLSSLGCSFPSCRAAGWTRPWAQPGPHVCGEGAPRGSPRGTGWAALMSAPWHPRAQAAQLLHMPGIPAASLHANPTAAAMRAPPHRAPRGTRHRVSLGIGCRGPAEVWGKPMAPGKDTRVAPGTVARMSTGVCRVLPAVLRQVTLCLAALPWHSPASRAFSSWGGAVPLRRCCCPGAHPCRCTAGCHVLVSVPVSMPVSGGSARGALPPDRANRANWHPG